MAFNIDYSPLSRVDRSGVTRAMSGLGGQIGGAISGGLEKRQQRKHQGLAREALAGDTDAQDELAVVAPEINKQVMEQLGANDEQKMKGLIYDFNNVLDMHSSGNQEAALNYMDQRISVIQERGGDAKDTQAVRDIYAQDPEQGAQVLSRSLMRMMNPDEFSKRLMPDASGSDAPDRQKTAAFLVRNKDTGEPEIAVGSFDPFDGSLTTETATFENHEVLSKMGETAKESTSRKVGEKGAIKTVEGQETRASDIISRGTLAAESSAVLRRGLELMEKVETGGIDAVALSAKRLFGVEGADEGELSRSLGKAVLAQLREIFGAQFTEREGSRLERLEAGFGKSVANNKRILQQTLKIVERTARRAMKAAEKRGDMETVDDIKGLLDFSMSIEPPSAESPDSVKGKSDEELMAIISGGQ